MVFSQFPIDVFDVFFESHCVLCFGFSLWCRQDSNLLLRLSPSRITLFSAALFIVDILKKPDELVGHVRRHSLSGFLGMGGIYVEFQDSGIISH